MATQWSHLALWDSQRRALQVSAKYFANPQQAALIQMPTGSGKTGVIAVAAAIRAADGPVLILSPAEALVTQLITEVGSRFWTTIGAPAHWNPDLTLRLLPSDESNITNKTQMGCGRVVLIGTTQALAQIAAQRTAFYAHLKRRVSAIFIDEGHREPAPEWAKAARGLGKPTILFSATPYRNDFRVFDVADDAVYYLSFEHAVRDKYLRNVEFRSLSCSPAATSFATAVVRLIDTLLTKRVIPADAKVIIRAASESRVTTLHNAFRAALAGRSDGFLAFHDTYGGASASATRLATVPDLRTRSERYLIHQYKLIEGIDEPRCAVFVPYDDFGNARNLVQQIGRVVRNPTPLSAPKHNAIVIAPPWSNVEHLWGQYLKYDDVCEKRNGPVIRTTALVNGFLKLLPDMEYVGRGFRARVDFMKPAVFDDVLIPRSCVIYERDRTVPIDAVYSGIAEWIKDNDRIIVAERKATSDDLYAVISIQLADSRYLTGSFFPEFSLHVTVTREVGEHLYYADAAGLCLPVDLKGVQTHLGADVLHRLFPEDRDTRINRIAARNSDIGPNAVRSRVMAARSLEDVAPFMGDHLHIASQVRGRTKASSARYVGFTRGRVRDEHASCTLAEFVDWTDALSAEFKSAPRASRYLSRYALPSGAPSDPAPKNILLDVGAIEGDFRAVSGETVAHIEDLCSDVASTPGAPLQGEFSFTIKGSTQSARIEFDRSSRRYKIYSDALDALIDQGNPKLTLLSKLNQNQAFRVLCGSSGYIYSSGQFYRIDTEYGLSSVRAAVLELLTPAADLATINSEKGIGPGNGATWTPRSLFRFIDDYLRKATPPFDGPFDYVVCDDLVDEIADFIATQNRGPRPRVVFLHAKAKKANPGAGASGLYEVTSQATKNLVYLRYGAKFPSRTSKWSKDWHIKTYTVNPRIRRGPGGPGRVRDEVQALLDQPNVDREMWLVLGRLLSKRELEASLRKIKPDYYAVQAAYLLMSADAACKSVGVRLRVFCSP